MSPERVGVTGVVLAGGASRRFGTDKLAADVDGRPLLHHPIERLLEVCDDVVVVLSPEGEEPSVPVGPVMFARDETAHGGPLAGLAAGLAIAGSDLVAVAGGDMPGLVPEVVRELLRAYEGSGAVVAVLSDGGDGRPLPCVVRTEPALAAARRLLAAGHRRLRDLQTEVTTVVVDEPTWTAHDPDRRTLIDVDEPSDLEAGRWARSVSHPSFTLGRYEVTPLCDGWAPLPLDDELPGVEVDWDAERERFPWAFPLNDPSNWAWHVHSFLIRHPDGLALVDAGIGHFGRSPYDVEGRLDEELGRLRVKTADVDDVVLTHLHADHSGGVCRPDGTPRFPNARHHVHPDDWTFFAEQRTPDDFTGRFAMAAVEEAGLLDLDPTDHTIAAGISLRHAPGHTPGHRVVVLEDRDDTLLLTGDLLHTTPQITHAAARSNHDEDPIGAAEQRSAFVASALTGGWTVGVSHFGLPFGRVVEPADAPAWSPV